jgi:ATP-dependent DNA helicase RecG
LEFKEAKSHFNHDKLYEYCVAIANEGGGLLLLGVADKPPRPVVGTSAFANPIKMAHQIFENVGFRVDIEEVQHPDGRVVVFCIPSRIKGSAYALNGAYLMRSGESLVPMSEDRLRAIFAENKVDWLEEYSKVGLDAEQVVELLDTQSLFELLRLPYPTNRDGVIERLEELKFIDAVGAGYSIRRLGAILIAKRLDHFPELARKAPRVVTYVGTSKSDTAADQPGNKGYAVGFQGLVKFVCNLLPQNEVIQDALRTSIKLVPDAVIRELLANALIHQDFEIGGTSMMVEVYSNRIEISNPGTPLVPVERFIDGCRSRNERFASLMRKLGVCEEKGSGIDTVIRTAEILQLPAPDFRTGYQTTHVLIYGPRPFAEMSRDDRIRACYQHCTLKYVVSERMTNRSLRERFKLAPSKSATVSQIIAQTEESSLIKVDQNIGGSRKYARYLPIWA